MRANRYKIRRGRLIKRADNIIHRDEHQAAILRRALEYELRPMIEMIIKAWYDAAELFIDAINGATASKIINPYPRPKKQEPRQ